MGFQGTLGAEVQCLVQGLWFAWDPVVAAGSWVHCDFCPQNQFTTAAAAQHKNDVVAMCQSPHFQESTRVILTQHQAVTVRHDPHTSD